MAPDQRRIELQVMLEELLGSRNVYFQPPATLRLSYPCIVYHRDPIQIQRADNMNYKRDVRYNLTYITREADHMDFIQKVLDIPKTSHNQSYTSDNLYHEIFQITY